MPYYMNHRERRSVFDTARAVHFACLQRHGYVQRKERGFYEAFFWSEPEQEWHHSGKVNRTDLLGWANALVELRRPLPTMSESNGGVGAPPRVSA